MANAVRIETCEYIQSQFSIVHPIDTHAESMQEIISPIVVSHPLPLPHVDLSLK